MMRLKRRSPALARGVRNFEAKVTSISITKISQKLRLAQALLAAQTIQPEAFAAMLIVAVEVRP